MQSVNKIINHNNGIISKKDLSIVSKRVSENTGLDEGKVAGIIAGGVYMGHKLKKAYNTAR
jgi:hypothetical protein